MTCSRCGKAARAVSLAENGDEICAACEAPPPKPFGPLVLSAEEADERAARMLPSSDINWSFGAGEPRR